MLLTVVYKKLNYKRIRFMNLINQMMISESNPKLNINGTEKVCNCGNCKPIENQTI